MKNTKETISQETALIELKKGYAKSEAMIKENKLQELLDRLEEKLKKVPAIGETLSHLPVFISLIKSYVKKEYTKIPIGTLTAIVSALLYVLSPVDLIPDFVPVLGVLDDATIVLTCFTLVESDIEEYLEWRETQKKIINV